MKHNIGAVPKLVTLTILIYSISQYENGVRLHPENGSKRWVEAP